MSFPRTFGDKYSKKIMDTAAKKGIDAAKADSKTVVQKTAETTRDLIKNKIADKITSVGKTKSKEKENERQEIYIPPEKRWQQGIVLIPYKNGIPKNYKFARYNTW